MQRAWLFLAIGCGRVGFDATAPDARATLPGSGAVTPGCDAFTQTVLAGASGQLSGDVALYADSVRGTCGGAGCGDFGAQIVFDGAASITFTLDAPFDSVLHVLDGAGCGGAEIACIDNPGGSGESIELGGADGQVFTLVADGSPGSAGFATISWGL